MKLFLTAALLCAFPALSSAQGYRNSVLYLAQEDSSAAPTLAYVPPDSIMVPRQPSIVLPLLGGAAGGAAGMFGGLLVGASIDNDEYHDDISPGMVYGFLAGEMILLPVGVHLGNGRKGSFLADLAVSAVIGSSVVLMTSASNDETPLLIGALAQYASVVAVERATARRKIERATILAREQAKAAGPPTPDSAATVTGRPIQPMQPPVVSSIEQPSLAAPIVLGVIAGTASGLLGARIGSDDQQVSDWDDGEITGFVIGETLMMPAGVHLGNARHGSFLGDLAVSAAGQLVSVLLAVAGPFGYITGISGQVALTVWHERTVGARRLREEAQAHAP